MSAQGLSSWADPQTIPGFSPKTEPPIMVVDQNQTVHAFSSQWFGENDGYPQLEIVYNQWSITQGWTEPIDVLLAPIFNEAWITSAFLDNQGIIHITFVGGHDGGANVYYSRVQAINAAKATAWVKPIQAGPGANTPRNAAFGADEENHFAILYGGNFSGSGIYAVFSSDGGNTWTKPSIMFQTFSPSLSTFGLRSYVDNEGWMHAVWEVVTLDGQGREIYYSKLKLGSQRWSDPIELAAVDTGYGVLNPTIAGNDKELIAVYDNTPKITYRLSLDHGTTWQDPLVPFDNHVGVNGNLSIVKDSNNVLHLFFGQRIPGVPDIHGMWHSVWENGQWTEPEAVVSGPQVVDHSGKNAFDPYDARAAVVQGNVILVTWRSDPGLNGNGVWYSYKSLPAPQLPLVPLPFLQATTAPLSITLSQPTSPVASPSPDLTNPKATPIPINIINSAPPTNPNPNPSEPIVMATIPVLVLMVGWILVRKFRDQRPF